MGDLSAPGGLAAIARIGEVSWALVRADALLPREIEAFLPAGFLWLGRALRLFRSRSASRGRPGERLARVLQRQGPAAIKLGQFLSTRGDMLGLVFAEDLSRLKDRLDPFPQAVAIEAVEQAFGGPIGALFSEFEEPIAAASLAQVHRARLLDGRAVAVKILRPGIEARVSADCAAMAWAADFIDGFIPAARRLDPPAFVATVARALELELDLRFEAAGADELRESMAADGLMGSPPIIWERVSRRVMTSGWVDGLALSDPAALVQPGLDRPALATALTRAFLTQALDHGAFHADLHEGNLFAAPPAVLTAVDFGIVGRLGAAERRFLAEILWGFLRRDYARIAAVHFDAGYVPAAQDAAAFAQALRAVGEGVFGRNAAQISMGRLLTQLFEITALFQMRLRPELILLQKTMVTVEGVARRIDPEHDIWAAAEPIVRRWITRELSPARRVRELAREIQVGAAAIAKLAARADGAPSLEARIATLEAGAQPSVWLAFAAGALVAATAFVIGVALR